MIANEAEMAKSLVKANHRMNVERRNFLELFNLLSHHFQPSVQKLLREAIEKLCVMAPEAFDVEIPPDKRLQD